MTPGGDSTTANVSRDEDIARRYVEQLRAFYIHLAQFVVGMAIMFAVNAFINLSAGIAGEWPAWWSAWAFLGWGIGVVVHGVVVRCNRPTFTESTWEQRQVERLLGR